MPDKSRVPITNELLHVAFLIKKWNRFCYTFHGSRQTIDILIKKKYASSVLEFLDFRLLISTYSTYQQASLLLLYFTAF
jgi:hypothetical protein